MDDRHVQRVGTGEPPDAELTIDLPGTTIVPGFIDSHVHLTATGRSLANADVRESRSKQDFLALIRGRASNGVAVVHVEGFDETRWDTHELPTAQDLDISFLRQRADALSQFVDDRLFPGAQFIEIDFGRAEADAVGLGCVGLADQLSRMQQGFGGNAAAIQANSAQTFVLVDQNDFPAFVSGVEGGCVPAGTGA